MNLNKLLTYKKARRKFINFTKKLWIQEVTEDEIGTMFKLKFKKKY